MVKPGGTAPRPVLGQVVERYTIEAELGEGGVATVYRVRHNTLDSLHALKVIHLSAASVKERLVQEGRVQAALKHPNIVTVTDVVDLDGSPGLIMELVDGPTLAEWLPGNRPELADAERLFRGILAGVARAHKLGLVHRDLKPGNVLLETADDGTLVPKVTDFGLAKILSEDEGGPATTTRSGTTMGTPAYMAPEQVKDAKTVDQRADIFALGCILYELCTGRSPFDRGDVLQVFAALAMGRYQPPEQYAPDLPPRIRLAIRGCLSVNRDARIQDCSMLRQVLDGRTDSWTSVAPLSDPLPLPETVLRAPGAPRPNPPSVPPPASGVSRFGLAAAGLGLVAGIGAALGGALMLAVGMWIMLRNPSSPPPVAPEPAAVAPAPAPVAPIPAEPIPAEPIPAEPIPAEPIPAEPIPAQPQPAAPAAPAPRTPVASPPKPSPPAPGPKTTGTVRADGDADRIWLEANGARFELGAVPSGEYVVKADFGGQGGVNAARVVVEAGSTVSLSCSAAFQMCQVKR